MTTEVVGIDKVAEVTVELAVAVVVVALDRCLLAGPVHSFDLTVGPRMVDFGKAMFDAILASAHVAHLRHEPRGWAVGVTRWQPELDAVVSEDGVNPVRHGRDKGCEECRCSNAVGLVDQRDEGKLAGSADSNEKVKLSFGSMHLGDVDVEEADGIRPEGLLGRFLALDVGQAADPVTLQATVQCGSR